MVFRGIHADPRGLATGIFGNGTNTFINVKNGTTARGSHPPQLTGGGEGYMLTSGTATEPGLASRESAIEVS